MKQDLSTQMSLVVEEITFTESSVNNLDSCTLLLFLVTFSSHTKL